jgi:tetratricopeptide (TPR) repeat protein
MKIGRSMLVLAAAALVATGLARAAGDSKKPEMTTAAQAPEPTATELYNRAIDDRDRAWSFEDRIEASTDEQERTKLRKKVRDAYQNAIEQLRRAVATDPGMHEAWGALGYAYRQTGRYAESLAAYDRALTIEPGYVQAIEYRAEAYLGLGRLDDAKEAYAELAAKDPGMANQLLDAMRSWIAKQREGGSASDATALAAWVDAQETDASKTSTGPRKSRSW